MSAGARRLAVVTGGSTGIGRASVSALSRAGWDVAFTYFSRPAEAEQTAAGARVAGAEVLCIRCDVGVKSEVDAFYDRVAAWRGVPDLLVNNAGVQTWESFLSSKRKAGTG